MPLHRKILIIISNSLFKLLLFMTISIIAAVFLYADRNYVPSVLSRNDVYNRVVNALLETNKEQSLTAGGDITLENKEIQQIITDAFPANDLENYATTIVDAVYDWLELESSTLSFTINLTENKQQLAEGLSIFAVNRLQKLPLCTENQANIDPFSTTCQPPFIDYTAEQIRLEEQLMNESGFLEDTIITEEIIFGNEQENSLEERYRHIPTMYSLVRFIPLYITLILTALALIVIFASSTRKIGIRKIGRGLIGAGGSLIFFTVLFTFIVPELTGSLPILQSTGQGIDSLLNEVAVDFGRDYSWMIIKVSTPLIVVGVLMVIYAQSGKNKKNYSTAKLKSGVVSGNEQKKKSSQRVTPPIQSSESSDTKPKRKLKNKKYRKIPKKEL